MKLLRRLLAFLFGLVVLAWVGFAAWAYWPGVPEVPVAQLATPEDRFVEVEGLQLRYRRYGEAGAGRPTIVLLHGFANSLQSFRALAPALAADAQVIAVDLPGFGLSDKPAPHDYSNAAQAQTVLAFARALGIGPFVVGGHSLGGAIAEHVALQGEEVTGLLLLNPGILSTGVGHGALLRVWPLPRASAKMFSDAAFRARALRQNFIDPAIVDQPVIDAVMLGARSEGYRRGMTHMMGQYQEGGEVPLLAQLRVPTLIVWGQLDRSKPADEAQRLQALIPGSVLVVVPGVGHYVHEEAPPAVAAAVRADLSRLARPRFQGSVVGSAGAPGARASQAAASPAVRSGAS